MRTRPVASVVGNGPLSPRRGSSRAAICRISGALDDYLAVERHRLARTVVPELAWRSTMLIAAASPQATNATAPAAF